MAGINFNDLPKNLQAKLQPYMTLGGAKSVEEAVAKAKEAKVWSDADDKALNALNGGANWGKTMDEVAFDSSKAKEYKQMAANNKSAKKVFNADSQKKSTGFFARANQLRSSWEKKLGLASDDPNITYSGAGKGLLYPLMMLGAMAFVACQKDVTVTQNQVVNIPRNDYSKQINEIINRLDKIENKYADQLNGIMQLLQTVVNNQNATRQELEVQLNNICNKLKALLEEIIKNQVDMRTDSNKNAADILAAILAIVNGTDNVEKKFADLMKILSEIKDINLQILDEIKKAKDELKATLNTNNQAVLNALAKLNDNDQQTLNVLNEIKGLINKFGTEGKSMAEAILVAIGNLDPNSKDYSAKLDAIIDLLKKLDANNEQRSKNVIDAISKLGVSISADLTAIYNKINAGGQTGKDYSEVLDAILKKLGEMQNDNNNNFAAVLKAIGQIDIKPQDLSWIKAHLDAILEAIKNHEVIVKVEGGKCHCCDKDGNTVHEGVLGDLNDLLG